MIKFYAKKYEVILSLTVNQESLEINFTEIFKSI